MTHVVLCGVGFSGTSTPDDGLVYTELTDWDGVTGARGAGDPVPSGHGSYRRSEVWRESRAISMKGAILADTVDEFHRIKKRVEAIPSLGEMRVDQGDGYWTRGVEIDTISIPDFRGGTAVEFTIDMLAPDPVRYSEWLTAGPATLPERSGGLILPAAFPWHLGESVWPKATVENWGELPVLPRVTVTGSAPSITVRGGPYRLEFGAFDGELVFDSEQRRAWLNGTDVTRDMVRREWPQVAPGEVADFFFDTDGVSAGTELLVEYRIGVW